jgi:hypothetical protein
MTEEHKKKMAEGRAKARLAAKQAQPVVDLAAGAERDEQRAINRDALEQRAQVRMEEAGIEAVDPAKLQREDREIRRHLRRKRHGDSSIPVDNMQEGYRYAWLTNGTVHGDQARADIRRQLADAKLNGYEPVQGDDPEAASFKGGDGVSGTSMRGVGDVMLYRIHEDDYRAMEEDSAEKERRNGSVEDRSVVFAQDRLGRQGLPNTMHNITDPNDHFATSRISPDLRSAVVMKTTQFTEGDLRRGTMKGPNGETLKPGFDRRI